MLKHLPGAVLCLAGLAGLANHPAAAGTIYKCSEGGKPSYHDRPCGPGATALPAPTQAAAPEALERLARERALLQEIEDARADQARREAGQARANERAQRAAAAQRRRCERLRLQHKWLDEDSAHAGREVGAGDDRAARARTRARRQAEVLAVECPG
ncbi:DUF4124 domain-containing protein [Massilia sp. X63]|uniref:DUF4124 domain-containing protein n=1 Tax=Massilia sp. X63 TaxID=3237285 RepID=UPI0034DD5525